MAYIYSRRSYQVQDAGSAKAVSFPVFMGESIESFTDGDTSELISTNTGDWGQFVEKDFKRQQRWKRILLATLIGLAALGILIVTGSAVGSLSLYVQGSVLSAYLVGGVLGPLGLATSIGAFVARCLFSVLIKPKPLASPYSDNVAKSQYLYRLLRQGSLAQVYHELYLSERGNSQRLIEKVPEQLVAAGVLPDTLQEEFRDIMLTFGKVEKAIQAQHWKRVATGLRTKKTQILSYEEIIGQNASIGSQVEKSKQSWAKFQSSFNSANSPPQHTNSEDSD